MSPDARQRLKALLIKHEHYEQFPYTDTTGNLTIGIGRNISVRGVSLNEALSLLDDDLAWHTAKLMQFCSWFAKLDDNRQIAVIDMAFNLGLQGFLGFQDTISALEALDYERAAKAMLDSLWAHQVGQRAIDLAYIIRTGELP